MFHGRRPFRRNGRGDHRRGDDDRFALNNGARRLGRDIDVDVALQSESLHRLATLCAELIEIRPFVYDGRVAVSNVGNVGRLIDDHHVAFRRQ